MSRPARVLPVDYQPFSLEERILRRNFDADIDTSDEARAAKLNYNAWKKRNPDFVTPLNLERLPPIERTAPAQSTDVAHGTLDGYAAGCRGIACANFQSAERMTCQQAHIRYAGDYSYRKAVDAGTATDLKPGYEFDDAGVIVTIRGGQIRTDKHAPRRETPIPAKPKTKAPEPVPVQEATSPEPESSVLVGGYLKVVPLTAELEYVEVTIPRTGISPFRPLPIDQVAAALGDPTYSLEEPPLDESEPARALSPIEELQIRFDQARLDLVNAEQASRHAAAQAQRELDLADETIRRLENQIQRMTTDHRAYTALAAAPEMPQGVWMKAFIVDPNPLPAVEPTPLPRSTTIAGRRTPAWHRRSTR